LRFLLIILFLTNVLHHLSAQQKRRTRATHQLTIRLLDQDKRFFRRQKIKPSYTIKDSASTTKQLQAILTQLHERAFLAATIDTVFHDSSQHTAFLFVGNRYEWADLQNGNVPKEILGAVGFKERLYINQPFYYKEVVAIQEKLLTHLENNGYPFAEVFLDSIRIDTQQIAAKLYYSKGPLIFFDELEIKGKLRNPKKQKKRKRKVRITKGFLSTYLGIKEGKRYDEKQVKKIYQRLRNLRYLQQYQTPYIVFKDDKAQVNLFLTDKPSSKVDVLFGLLPSQDPVTKQQRFDFTGNIHVDLTNPLGTGKRLMFKWQQIKAGTSDLIVRFEWPYVLRTPLGADLAFKLYKRDSTFIDIIGDIGIQYLFNGNSYIKAFWKPVTTNLINVNTTAILNSRQLPSTLDLRNNTFGLEYYYNNLDYQYNPKKGFETTLNIGFVLKKVRRNNAILEIEDPAEPTFDFGSLYDTLSSNSFQFRMHLEHEHFFQLWKWSTLLVKADIGLVTSKSPIYTSELYRIGGNQRLRGFDEESIFASWYNILTLEWRFLFGNNSYAYVFGDVAYIQNKSADSNMTDWPFGFGVGIALETKVGIFGLSYALGAQQGNPILFQNSKVHFGYIYSF